MPLRIDEWKESSWWRVLRGTKIVLYCQTDKKEDAKSLLYPGEYLQRMQVCGQSKRWKPVV